jgi:hypothetical protein
MGTKQEGKNKKGSKPFITRGAVIKEDKESESKTSI